MAPVARAARKSLQIPQHVPGAACPLRGQATPESVTAAENLDPKTRRKSTAKTARPDQTAAGQSASPAGEKPHIVARTCHRDVAILEEQRSDRRLPQQDENDVETGV